MRSKGYCSWVCLCVCVCLLSHISPLECLFVLKTLSHTQLATNETPPLQRSSISCIVRLSFVSHFSLCNKMRMRWYMCSLASQGHAFSRRHSPAKLVQMHVYICAEGLHFSAFIRCCNKTFPIRLLMLLGEPIMLYACPVHLCH